jgi:hypothetical protein
MMTALIGPGATVFVEVHDHRRFDARSVWEGSRLRVGFTTDGARLGTPLSLPDVWIGPARSLQDGLERFADRVAAAMDRRPERPPTFHWCSWYYRYQNFDQRTLEEYAAAFAELPPDARPTTLQIDAGYCRSLGDWLEPNERWPEGLRGAFAAIERHGFRAGVWIGPFMVGNRSRLFETHPEWVLRAEDGSGRPEFRMYGEQRLWGYGDEEVHALDTSHPDAMAYLSNVFRQLRSWGCTFFKTDFMYMGLRGTAGWRRHAPGRTAPEYLRDVLAMIRASIGEEAYWLGCIAPFAPFVGYADGMRVGGDVVPEWGDVGPNAALVRCLPEIQHVNGRWWHNDPDALLLRDFHTHLTPTEAEALALWQGFHAGAINTSDPLHRIAPDRLALWRWLAPGAGFAYARTLRIASLPPAVLAAAKRVGAAHAFAFLNTGRAPERIDLDAATLGVPSPHGEEVVREWFPGKEVSAPPQYGRITATLAPHQSRLFLVGDAAAAASQNSPASGRPG